MVFFDTVITSDDGPSQSEIGTLYYKPHDSVECFGPESFP